MIKQDYKSQKRGASRSKSVIHHRIPFHWGEMLAVAVGIILLGFAFSGDDSDGTISSGVKTVDSGAETGEIVLADTHTTDQSSYRSSPREEAFVSDSPKDARIPLELDWEVLSPSLEDDIELNLEDIKLNQRSVEIQSGDTLSGIFKKQGFTAQDVYRVTRDKTSAEFLTRLIPGKTLTFETNDNNVLEQINYQISVNENLQIKRTADGFVGELITEPLEVRQAFASGTIKDSLFNAGKQAGLSDNMIVKLANIFGWDIDFVLDVRENDTFALIYEQQYLDGEFISDGDILAAQFVNQGEVFQAVKYTDKSGRDNYYTPSGDSMRKAFLRAPVNFMYISSNFKPRRFHPILKRWKAHRGIDYRAPTGTPIYAAGDGKVIASSYNKFNGKYIFIQHGNSIVTKYLHLSRRSVSRGKRVKQGQVIGYVGATGLAEAPHLHYEFVVNGVHRNPRTVKLPQAAPISEKEISRFKDETASLLASLEARQRLLIDVGN